MEGQSKHSEGWPIRHSAGGPDKSWRCDRPARQVPTQLPGSPHTHPYAETVTVISGSLGFGEGEKFDNKGELLKPGAFLANPAKHAHYAWTGNEEAIVQVQFIGPGGIDYINPADAFSQTGLRKSGPCGAV